MDAYEAWCFGVAKDTNYIHKVPLVQFRNLHVCNELALFPESHTIKN